jgi:tetratricopeptide (TPR) repeat protein
VDVEELAVEASIERLKARPVLAIPLAVALDEWISRRRRVFKFKGDDAGCKRLVAVADGIDPEPLRDRLRSTPWPPIPGSRDELRRLAESIDVRAHHPATLYRLAVTLRGDSAIRILRDAQVVYPGDYWLNYELGSQLADAMNRTNRKPNLDGAIRFYTVAASVRPSAAARYVYPWLGQFLRERGDLDEAIAVYRQLGYWDRIVDILRAQGKPDEAIAVYRQHGDWYGIGDTLRAQGKPDEAIAAYRQAIEAMPEDAGTSWAIPKAVGTSWRSIGDTLRDQKKPAEAADAYRKAIAAYRQAVEAMPENAGPGLSFDSIGDILRAQGNPDEAIAVYRQAIEAGSKAADSYWRAIGDTMRAQGKPDEAIAAYRQAIEAKPEAADS